MRLIDTDTLLNSFKGAKKLGVDAIKFGIVIDIRDTAERIIKLMALQKGE